MYPRSKRLDHHGDPVASCPTRLGGGPEKNMLYSASSCLRSERPLVEIAFDLVRGRKGRAIEEGETRPGKPQLVRKRYGPVVDEDFGGVRAADDVEELRQVRRVARPGTGPGTGAPRRIHSRNSADARAKPAHPENRDIRPGRKAVDRKGPLPRRAPRTDRGIEATSKHLVSRLLGEFRVRPETRSGRHFRLPSEHMMLQRLHNQIAGRRICAGTLTTLSFVPQVVKDGAGVR